MTDKELQDLAWSLLPKEFKEEVRKLYAKFYNEKPHSDCSYGYLGLLIKLFGIHNLTSDAEGEEMLTVPRKELQASYDYHKARGHHLLADTLYGLFGSKCLPDDNEDNVTTKELKPAEPKFKVGDKVRYKGFIGTVCQIEETDYVIRNSVGGDLIGWIKESDLEPYTEPTKNVNFSQNIANCDKHLDNILKDSSRNNRLQIAAMAMQGILSNYTMLQNLTEGETTTEGVFRRIAKASLNYTDALIKEAQSSTQSLCGAKNGGPVV